MNSHEAITELRTICIEEAVTCKVPPALIEILLIRALFKAKKRQYLVPLFLKSGALCRLLFNWNGPFKVLLDKAEPTIEFADGTIIGENFNKLNPAIFRWERLITLFYMDITPYQRDVISKRLLDKAVLILNLVYA